MDEPLTIEGAIALALVLATTIGIISFLWPANAFRRGLWAIVCALIGPFVIAYIVEPFLGSGAGLGVALVLYVLAAAILIGAVAAILGAVCRYAWDALRRAA